MQCYVKVMQCHAMSYSVVTAAPDRHFGTAVMEHTLVTSPLRGGPCSVNCAPCKLPWDFEYGESLTTMTIHRLCTLTYR